MGFFKRKPKGNPHPAACPVQIRSGSQHPFQMMDGYIPLHSPEFGLYRAIREAVPVVDAAVLKLIRLASGVRIACRHNAAEAELNHFLRVVNTGWNQQGIQSFLDGYLDSLLTCGRAVGEIVPHPNGRDIEAVLCGNVSDIEIRQEESPLQTTLCLQHPDGHSEVLPHQDLLLFTPYNPTNDAPYGVSLLHSMPFLSNILLKIYQTLGINWERAGNLRFSVIYKPNNDAMERTHAQERSAQLAEEWSAAMQSTKAGSVRDFVAVGDVEIKVIGAESEIPDCQVPVRQIVEQLIAQTGIPPFMLGLNWSSTERMSTQQADIMTSELTALRRNLTPPLEKICRFWLQMHGYDCEFEVEWADINLQDQLEEARAELYRQQARKLELELNQTEAAQ